MGLGCRMTIDALRNLFATLRTAARKTHGLDKAAYAAALAMAFNVATNDREALEWADEHRTARYYVEAAELVVDNYDGIVDSVRG